MENGWREKARLRSFTPQARLRHPSQRGDGSRGAAAARPALILSGSLGKILHAAGLEKSVDGGALESPFLSVIDGSKLQRSVGWSNTIGA